MTKEQFFDWLSGYFDICEPDRVGVVETQTIKDHIDLVRGVEKLPPAMTEEDTKIFCGSLPPISLNESLFEVNFSPPPPVINTKGILPKLPPVSPFSNATVC